MFGKDALSYEFDKGLKWVVISPDCLPIYQYDHALWEPLFPTVLTGFTSFLEQPQSPQAIPASSPASSNTGPVSSSSTSLSSSPATSPSNSSCGPLSNFTVDTKTAFVPQPSEPLFIHDLWICAANDCSRGQLATLNLPPVIQIPDDDVELVVDPGHLNNPLQSPVRPLESAITKGYRLMDAQLEKPVMMRISTLQSSLEVYRQHAETGEVMEPSFPWIVSKLSIRYFLLVWWKCFWQYYCKGFLSLLRFTGGTPKLWRWWNPVFAELIFSKVSIR